MNALIFLIVTSTLAASVSCHHTSHENIIFYLHPIPMTGLEASNFCDNLVGSNSYEFRRQDFHSMSQLRSKVDAGLWLSGSQEDQGYRWGVSSAAVSPDLWLPSQPNCAADCGIIFAKSIGGYGLVAGQRSSHMYPLCVIDTKDAEQVNHLKSKLTMIEESDRMEVEKILNGIPDLEDVRENKTDTTTTERAEFESIVPRKVDEKENSQEPDDTKTRSIPEMDDLIERMNRLEQKVDALIEFIKDPSRNELPDTSYDDAAPVPY